MSPEAKAHGVEGLKGGQEGDQPLHSNGTAPPFPAPGGGGEGWRQEGKEAREGGSSVAFCLSAQLPDHVALTAAQDNWVKPRFSPVSFFLVLSGFCMHYAYCKKVYRDLAVILIIKG